MQQYQNIDEIIQDLLNNPIEKNGHLYHPIPFPEFQQLTTSSNSKQVWAKWHIMEESLKPVFPQGLAGRKVLDIGANAGFFSFTLAQKGAQVWAFEPNPRYATIGRCLALQKNLPVTWYEQPFDLSLIESHEFDLGLMLSVFQWICQGNSHFQEGKELLLAISKRVRFLFFELGVNYGKSAIQTRKLNHMAFVHSLLKDNTAYSQIKLIGVTHLWDRPLSKKSPIHRIVSLLLQRLYRIKGARFLFLCCREEFPVHEPGYAFFKHLRI